MAVPRTTPFLVYMQMARYLGIAVIAWLALAACGSESRPPIEPPVIEPPVIPPLAQIPQGIHVIAGLSPTLGYSDLAPFAEIVGDATVVGLGESTHTSGGYYQAKARLVRYMVEQLGFRVVAMETPWLEARVAEEYVRSCAGTAEQATRSLLVVWRDAAVRDLLGWLCAYNQSHASDPVYLFGFDIQEPWSSAAAFDAFVRSAAPSESARIEPLYSCLGTGSSSLTLFYQSQQFLDHYAGKRNTTAHANCLAGITSAEQWLEQNSAGLTASSSARSVEEARLALMGLRAWEEQFWLPDPAWYEVRDRAMANMMLRVRALEAPGKKMAVWAWNWHVAWRYEVVTGWDADTAHKLTRQGGRSMGGFLRDSLGAGYRPIGLVGYQVHTFSAQDPIPTHGLSIERWLNQFDADYLLVDLRAPIAGGVIAPGTKYSISREWADPYQQYSALLFLAQSPGMTFVP